MKNIEKNCIKLAADVTDSMDTDDLLDFVRSSLVRQYLKNKDFFDNDWNDMYGEDS